jgi:hypothetical protein
MIKAPDNLCPRCQRGVPSDKHRGEYPGALSRTDNETEICSNCGISEALEQVIFGGALPQDRWKDWA